jgi:FixJ family two-component response regulator
MTDGAIVAVIDDDLSVRRGLERLLRSAGYRVQAFSSAREFLGYNGSPQPECLVLDVSMPGQSGLHLHDVLVAMGRKIPVIFITGHGDVAMAARAMKAGAADFLSKPFDDEVLLKAVEKALKKP